MHASSGQENITCGETARGPTERGAGRGAEGRRDWKGTVEEGEGQRVPNNRREFFFFFFGGGILGRKRKRIKNEWDSQNTNEGREIIQRQSEKMEA